MTTPFDEETCQDLFKDLLAVFIRARMHHQRPSKPADMDLAFPSSLFVRQLLIDTPHCDLFSDLSDMRNIYQRDILQHSRDDKVISRIVDFKNVTEEDDKIVDKVAGHYATWTEDRLISSFNWRNWLRYQLIDWWKMRKIEKPK